jgi:hypothetical protein
MAGLGGIRFGLPSLVSRNVTDPSWQPSQRSARRSVDLEQLLDALAEIDLEVLDTRRTYAAVRGHQDDCAGSR